MAEVLVPPHGSCIIKCKKCKGIYIPSKTNKFYGNTYFEECPFCGTETNNFENTIPVWMYNLLKFFRSGKHVEDIEANIVKFKTEEPQQNLIKKKEPDSTPTLILTKDGFYYL